jgi:fatty acid desaturase
LALRHAAARESAKSRPDPAFLSGPNAPAPRYSARRGPFRGRFALDPARMPSPATPAVTAAPADQDERDGGNYLASLAPAERTALLAQVKTLSELKPWRSIAALLGDWVLIVGVISAALLTRSTWVALLAVVVVGSRQHALSLLMHDGAHRRLAKDGALNDTLSDWLCAYPLFYTTAGYKASHFPHHRFLNTAQDPDYAIRKGQAAWTFPQPRAQLWLTMAKQGLGFSAYMILRMLYRYGVKNRSVQQPSTGGAKSGGAKRYSRPLFYVVLFTLLTVSQLWTVFLLFWVLPAFTVLPLCMRVRSWAEHFGLPWNGDLGDSRTILTNAFGRFFFAPHNGGYHLDHHLFPAVPFYNLPKLHDALMQTKPYRESASVADGYLFGRNTVIDALAATTEVTAAAS